MVALAANNLGQLRGKFRVPANVPAGRKEVIVSGSQGSRGGALFIGEGTMETYALNRLISTLIYRYDPLAQTFTMSAAEQVKAIDLYVLTKGAKPIRVQIRETGFGVPSQVVLCECVLPAAQITAGTWNRFAFPAPVSLSPNVEYAIVILSDEAEPAVGIAELGKYDSASASWVTSQPYQVGVLLSSSNASTWTPKQDGDLAFRIIGNNYTEASKSVALGTIPVTNATDIRLQGLIESPAVGASGRYELTLPDGRVFQVANGQVLKLSAPISGNINVRAILTGTAKQSAILHPGTFIAAGKIASTADYITAAIEADALGANIRVVYDAIVPSGATIRAYYKGLDDGDQWIELGSDKAPIPLGDELYEFSFKADAVKEARVRIKLVLTGTAAARPRARNLRVTVL